MTDNKPSDTPENPEEGATTDAPPSGDASSNGSSRSGPTFTKSPDPMATVRKGAAGVKKGATDVLDSMEGKTVSMKTYVGTIIGVIVLMMLARCGG